MSRRLRDMKMRFCKATLLAGVNQRTYCRNRARPESDYCWNHRLNEVQAGLPKGSCVYFLRRGDQVKIGWSTQLYTRLTALQATPDDLMAFKENWGWLEEQTLHRHFADKRMRGEWFRADTEFVTEVERILGHKRLQDAIA